MGGISGQPTPTPKDLNSPVPSTAAPQGMDNEDVYAELGNVPSIPAIREPQQQADNTYAELDTMGPDGTPQAAGASQEIPGQVTDPNLSPWESAKQQVSEAATRFKNAFTVTNNESLAVLKQSGMFDDVRIGPDGNMLVKRKGRPTWEHFDSDKIELLGDALDMSRDAFEGIIENVGRIGGAIGGAMAAAPEGAAVGAGAGTAVAPGPGTVIGGATGAVSSGMAGAVPGGMAGGAAGAVAAKTAGDVVAQGLLGIPKDPERNTATEDAQAAALGAGFNFLASKVARRAANRRATEGEAKKTMEFAQQKLAEAQADIAEVTKSGIKLDKAGKFFLDPQQVVGQGAIPELDATAKDLSKNQSFRNFREHISNNIIDAYNGVANMIGAKAGRGATMGDDFVLSSQNVREAEGRMIGAFRAQAADQLQGAKGVIPRTVQVVQMASSAMKTPQAVQIQLGLTPAQAVNYISELKKLAAGINATNGTMSLEGAFAKEQALTKIINKNMDNANNRSFGMALIQLRDAVRDDALDMMEQSFGQMGGGPNGSNKLLEQFKNAKGRYREIMEATGNLGKMLETDNLSRNEVLGKLFEGKGSYKYAMNAKTLINETHPQLWDQMTGEYFVKLKNDATSALDGTVNWAQMSKKWSNLDPRLQDELLKSSGLEPKTLDALFRLGTRTQQSSFEALPGQMKAGAAGWLKNIFIASFGSASRKGDLAGSLLEGMGKNQALVAWLKDGGMEEVLKQMPGMQPSKKAALRDWIEGVAYSAPSKTMVRRRAEETTAP